MTKKYNNWDPNNLVIIHNHNFVYQFRYDFQNKSSCLPRKGAQLKGIGKSWGLLIIQVCLCGLVGGWYAVWEHWVLWSCVGEVGIWKLFLCWVGTAYQPAQYAEQTASKIPNSTAQYPSSPMRPHKHTWIISNPWTLPMPCNCTLFWSTLLLKILIKHFIVTIQFPGTFKYWVVGIKILFFLLTQTLFCIRLTVCYVFNGSAFWPHTI